MEHMKTPRIHEEAADLSVRQNVEAMIANIRSNGEAAVKEYAKKFDSWTSDFVLSDEKRKALIAQVSESDKADIQFAYKQVARFAQAQRDSIQEFSIETEPGVRLGQKLQPVSCAGCYVPGGRYAHAASAIMSIATAKVAGVPFNPKP